jgi:hypothetical protein
MLRCAARQTTNNGAEITRARVREAEELEQAPAAGSRASPLVSTPIALECRKVLSRAVGCVRAFRVQFTDYSSYSNY